MTVLPEVHRGSKCWRYFVLLKFVLYRILGFWLAKIHTVQSNWNALNVSLSWLVCCNSPLLHVRIHIINQSLTLVFSAPVFYLKRAKIFAFPSLSPLFPRNAWYSGYIFPNFPPIKTVIQQSVYQRWGSLRRIIYIFCSPPGLFNSPVISRFFFLFF